MARYGWYEGERLKDLVGTPEPDVRAAEPVSFAEFQAARSASGHITNHSFGFDGACPACDAEMSPSSVLGDYGEGDELLASLSLYDPSVAAETLFLNGDLVDNATGEVLMQEADWSVRDSDIRPELRLTREQQLLALSERGVPMDAIRDAAFIHMRFADTAAGITSRYTTEKREWRS